MILLSANVTHGLIDPAIDAYGPTAFRGRDMQHLGFSANFSCAYHSPAFMGPRSGTTTCTTSLAHVLSTAPALPLALVFAHAAAFSILAPAVSPCRGAELCHSAPALTRLGRPRLLLIHHPAESLGR